MRGVNSLALGIRFYSPCLSFVQLTKPILTSILKNRHGFLGKFIFDQQKKGLLISFCKKQINFPQNNHFKGFFNAVELLSGNSGMQLQLIPKNPNDLGKIKGVKGELVRLLGEAGFSFEVKDSEGIGILINVSSV